MASNFLQQLPGLLPFGWKKDHTQLSETSPSPITDSITGHASYRARKSISEAHHPMLEQRMSMSLINKGLLNPTGENNCFLNSAVQILWHIDVFRRSFRKVKGHACVEKACIFCALRALFNDFQHGGQSAIPPDILRQAMADCYEEQQRFQLGLMDDAAECFEKILEQIHLHLTGSEDMDTCSVKHCLSHQKFSLTILERTECVCGATSEPLSFVQFVHYISSSAIVKEAKKIEEKIKASAVPKGQGSKGQSSKGQGSKEESAPNTQNETTPTSDAIAIPNGSAARPRLNSVSQAHFGKILNLASSFGEYRQCPDFERCKQKVSVKRLLLNCPDVVCLGMIWDSAQPSVEEIMGVVLSIGLTLQLNDLFDHVFADSAQINQYELTALIAYYGRHYSTFCYHSKMREWIYFDDAKFRKVGTDWSDVCEVIRKAHYQPLLLVYTNPFAEPLDMSDAPQEVTKMHFKQTEPVPSLASITEEQATPASQKANTDLPSSNVKAPVPLTQPKTEIRTHSIDPMTLSLVPFQQQSNDKIGTKKATSPIVEGNQACATPTSRGAVPVSAQQLAAMSAGGVKGQGAPDDLMTFSISPAMIEGMMGQKPNVQAHPGTTHPATGGHHLEYVAKLDSSEEDLIKFSIMSPYTQAMSRNTVLSQGAPMAVNSSQGMSRTANFSQAAPITVNSSQGISRTANLSQGLSALRAANSPQQDPRSPSLSQGAPKAVNPSPGASRHVNFSQAPSAPSPMQNRVPQRAHSPSVPGIHQNPPFNPSPKPSASPQRNRSSLPSVLPNTSPRTSPVPLPLSSKAEKTPPPLRPEWEHFSDDLTKPSGGAPQKLLHKVGGAQKVGVVQKGGGAKTASQQVRQEDKEKVWTVVSKVEPSSESASEGSSALHQLKRLASLSDGEVISVSDPSIEGSGESFVLENVFVRRDETKGDGGSDGSKSGVDRHFLPLPLTPDQLEETSQALLAERELGFEIAPSGDLGATRSSTDRTMLLEDLEYAFPAADNMFSDATATGAESSKVKGRGGESSEVKGRVGAKELDYAELDFDLSQPRLQSGGAKEKKDDKLDYVEIRRELPVKPEEQDRDEYSHLVDVRVQRTSDQPIGNDPLYATVDKTPRGATKSAVSKETRVSSSAGGTDAVGRKGRGHVTTTTETQSHNRMGDVISALSPSSRQKLQDAQNLFAQAEASTGSDDTVAMMLYQQFSTMMFQVLQDPKVQASSLLHQQIKARRDEGVRRCQQLRNSNSNSTREVTGVCKKCGQKRSLDDQQLCGPCKLREKLKQ